MQSPASAWLTVTWRKGSNAALCSRFAAVRVRPARGDHSRSRLRDEEWLLIGWPEADKEPFKYFLSTAPGQAMLEHLVMVTKMRCRIERYCQDLRPEFGLGHYEGRGWCGFHHHATLSIAAYDFLMPQRLEMGSTAAIKNLVEHTLPVLPPDYIPRGSPARTMPRS